MAMNVLRSFDQTKKRWDRVWMAILGISLVLALVLIGKEAVTLSLVFPEETQNLHYLGGDFGQLLESFVRFLVVLGFLSYLLLFLELLKALLPWLF